MLLNFFTNNMCGNFDLLDDIKNILKNPDQSIEGIEIQTRIGKQIKFRIATKEQQKEIE